MLGKVFGARIFFEASMGFFEAFFESFLVDNLAGVGGIMLLGGIGGRTSSSSSSSNIPDTFWTNGLRYLAGTLVRVSFFKMSCGETYTAGGRADGPMNTAGCLLLFLRGRMDRLFDCCVFFPAFFLWSWMFAKKDVGGMNGGGVGRSGRTRGG